MASKNKNKGENEMKLSTGRSVCIALIFALIAPCFGCGAPQELQGTWIGYAADKPRQDWILTIRDDKFSLTTEDFSKCFTGQLALNSNCGIKKIDLEYCEQSKCSYDRNISYGIFKIEDDTLTLVAGQPGQNIRPHSFEDPDDAVIFIFEKIRDFF